MQRSCEEKKEGEALQLCRPRKVPPTPPTQPRQTLAQAVARPGYRIPKRQPQPQVGAHDQSKLLKFKGAWAKKPSPPLPPLWGPKRSDTPPNALLPEVDGTCFALPPKDVLFLKKLKRAYSRPYKRRAEAMLALRVHSHVKRRKVSPAESSMQSRVLQAHTSVPSPTKTTLWGASRPCIDHIY
ncbi:hypothetical protein N1851_000558 [Merluccius polli]|uniref:Uncharacterized protein n=1 Tax=Merluccius polli TaxID=89951 RepID=A0AA47NCV7_MERPO|nr:hypothetical protein N1851_000558 [Merluccius polli]